MEEKCIINPERDCLGLLRAKELEKDLSSLEGDLNDLRRQNSASHERIFDRLNEVEKQEAIQKVQFETILDKLGGLAANMTDLKEEGKLIAEKLPALSHKVAVLEKQSDSMDNDVDRLKEKPGKTWESIKEKGIGWLFAVIMGIVAAALGLSKYL